MLVIVLMLMQGFVSAFAAENGYMPDLVSGKKGTLTICCEYNTNGKTFSFSGMKFKCTKVATINVKKGVVSYIPEVNFAVANISFTGMTASKSNEAAKKLYQIAKQKDLKMTASETGSSGCVTFSNLNPGMYLVVQSSVHKQGRDTYSSEPFLVSVPLASGENKNAYWEYSVTSMPKISTYHPGKVPDKPDLPGKNPRTGDTTPLAFWGILMISAGFAITILMYVRRKKDR
ncbi:hypothetical protein BHK98_02735 [Hornefia porci]|uniref:Gram-positive pilin subunit D1 N-terminal domain-containing protein n=1 Tax=Hornefia porci TaxID=2652292 RepID=A0A1Q9JL25_9FIRM|nr:hypothetical protein BHK98_02735 [Hornefia porci]